jgi:hypothetical protein
MAQLHHLEALACSVSEAAERAAGPRSNLTSDISTGCERDGRGTK